MAFYNDHEESLEFVRLRRVISILLLYRLLEVIMQIESLCQGHFQNQACCDSHLREFWLLCIRERARHTYINMSFAATRPYGRLFVR